MLCIVLGYIEQGEEIAHDFAELQMLVDRIDTLDLTIGSEGSLNKIELQINNILKFLSERGEIAKKEKKLSKLIQSISEEENEGRNALKSLEALQKKFNKHMTVCPLCNTKLK